jgi:hypothetical protein
MHPAGDLHGDQPRILIHGMTVVVQSRRDIACCETIAPALVDQAPSGARQ